MHDSAWREKVWGANRHIRGPRRLSQRPAHTRGSDVADNGTHEVTRRFEDEMVQFNHAPASNPAVSYNRNRSAPNSRSKDSEPNPRRRLARAHQVSVGRSSRRSRHGSKR